ncbi:MAG: acetate--CoA ligase [Chloroflexi bacterium]|jgi:acetyl-CoA synthetase|nr:acetate--CoA ligase [Chloroflexota bacterium]
MTTETEVVWRPTPAQVERTRLWRFLRRQGLADFSTLVARAAEDPVWFWKAAIEDLELEFYHPYQHLLDTSRGIPWATWFRGGRYNYVHNALDKHAAARPMAPAILWEGEEGQVRQLSYAELRAESDRLAHALRQLGVVQGDRVGLFLPMVPEAAVALLACAKLGAIALPLFSGFAAPAVAARLNDSEARVLITADGFFRRGQVVPMKPVADEAVAQSPSVERVLVLRRAGQPVTWQAERDSWWHDLVARQPASYPTAQTDPEDPCLILYTSGTTGRPKGAVHAQAGFPVKATQDMAHCFDVQPGDRLFWVTDLGWMMGPWAIIGALTLGATVMLYDGAPDYPSPGRLWEMVARHRLTVLGISPTLVRGLMRHGEEWVARHDRSSLRMLGSTGEPWNPVPWHWFFTVVGGGQLPIINYSGGTEVSGGIVSGTPITPLKPCSFAGPVPGMAADVVDEQGRSVRGEVGELVIRQPWPGMTRGFWRDPQRYLETYWSRWPNVWVHGDWARIDADGFWYIEGRSDDTLKVAGKRIGPAEVESAAVSHPAVSEAAAIGVPHELKGEAVVVFAVLKPGSEPSAELEREVQETVTSQLGKPLRPERVFFVNDLPKTRNAKVLRRLVRAVYLGKEDLGDLSSLENPAALDEIRRVRG